MLNRRIVLGLLASASSLVAGGALAQKGQGQKGQDQKGPGKKPKKHQSGHQLLGAKIKQNGKHKIGKAGKADVEVEVKGGKVAALTAGSFPVKKVKSKEKLADAAPSLILASATSDSIRLAQVFDWYYGYWVDADDADYYYWFTPDEVYVDSSWVEYSVY
jgi:hypothetical protein